MKPIKLEKKETEKVKSNFGHTANEWGDQRDIFKIYPIEGYDPKRNVNRNDDESN